jgi:hypothetical protein
LPATTAYMIAALGLVSGLETIGNVPIAVLERTGDDTEAFWNRSAQILCAKTGDSLCSLPMTMMRDNTNPLGLARIIRYVGSNGERRRVCAVVPPAEDVSPMLTATGVSGGNTYSWEDLPSSPAARVWLMLQNAAHCLDADGGAGEDKRADAFASLGTTLIFGDPSFTAPGNKSPARVFGYYRNADANRWAVNLGERILLDTWKSEAAGVVQARTGCALVADASSRLDVDQIPRDRQVAPEDVCVPAGQSGGPRSGRMTDANLWIWMYQTSLGAPPQPWTPLKTFGSTQAAASYVWDQAGKLSQR